MNTESLEFDYIIVGAGSAGCVLANGLSADPSCRVLLLEAGIPDKNVFLKIPAGVYRVFRDPKFNWNYYTEPEKSLNNRTIFTPRGKVLGGSSSINSMVYMRGHPLDYDRWASECGLSDWSFSKCLPYFIDGENFSGGKSKWRGSDGLLSVT
ncbi:MAG: GMC family oxidoreductase, partial [Paracoccaceae bacterium]